MVFFRCSITLIACIPLLIFCHAKAAI